MLEFRPLTESDMETIRVWRHCFMETLRTPYMLTQEQQNDYYQTVICNRDSKTRYWAFYAEIPEFDEEDLYGRKGTLIGYGGIEAIEWENRRGEISVLIGPEFHGKGFGRQAVEQILAEAFGGLNLETVHGECYYSGAVDFWTKILEDKKAYFTRLPKTKYYRGKYWDSLYFTFFKGGKE
jgi:RimJ/RimL family protein N-acetyltransferase